MRDVTQRTLLVGSWRVDPALNRLSQKDESVRVTPKVMQVLMCLAERPGRAVTREQLFESVWPGTVVSEDVLTRAVSDLRKAFGDDATDPRYVETIPKTGYRLLAPVLDERSSDGLPAAGVHLAPAHHTPTAPRRSRLWLGGGLVAVAAVAVTVWWASRPSPSPYQPLRVVPATSMPGREIEAVLSPDGSRLAFSHHPPGEGRWGVYVKAVGDERARPLVDGPADEASPTWSPDGTRIAFMQFDDAGCTIRVVDALGGDPELLSSCGANVTPDLTWSPDGAWLAFSDRPSPDESFSIYLVAAATGEKRRLTAPGAQHWGDHAPSFSPDGRRVAFTTSTSMATQDVFVVSVDGGTPARLTRDARAVRGHTWTADGQSLIVSSERGGAPGLWRVPLDGGAPQWMATSIADPRRPRRRGGRLVVESWTTQAEIRQLHLGDGETPAPWLPSTRTDLHPAFSPDGSRVAFASDRSGHFEIWTSDRAGTGAVQLTRFDGGFTGSPHWSPDGTRIVFDARPEGQADVFVVDAEGGRPRRLTSGSSSDLAPSWSADGLSIFFASNRTGAWQVWQMDADGTYLHQITSDGGFVAQQAADGILYYSRYDQPGLWRMPAGGSDGTRVPGTDTVRDWDGWVLTRTGLYFMDRNTVVRLDPVTLDRTGVTTIMPAPLRSGLAVAPDGQTLLFSQPSPSESDIVSIDLTP